MKIPQAILIFIYVGFSSGMTTAQLSAPYDEIVYARLRTMLPNLVSEINLRLRPEDVSILSQTDVRTDRRNLTNAFAGIDANSGRKTIVIFNGMVLVIDLLAQIMIVGLENEYCAKKYLNYLYEAYEENTDRARRDLPPLPGPYEIPFGYFSQDPLCQDAANILLTMPSFYGDFYREMVEASVTLLFLHELAHINLGHFSEVDLETSRQQEMAADAWALMRLPLMYEPVILATPLLIHIALTNGAALEDEKMMTHPFGPRRLLVLMDFVLAQEADAARRQQLLELRAVVQGLMEIDE